MALLLLLLVLLAVPFVMQKLHHLWFHRLMLRAHFETIIYDVPQLFSESLLSKKNLLFSWKNLSSLFPKTNILLFAVFTNMIKRTASEWFLIGPF